MVLFQLMARDMDDALNRGRGIVGDRGPDVTVMESDDRDQAMIFIPAAMSGLAEARGMVFSTEVTCAGWTCRIEFDVRAELGAVSFLRGERTEACMVLPAIPLRDLLMGIGALPYDAICRIAERDEHAGVH